LKLELLTIAVRLFENTITDITGIILIPTAFIAPSGKGMSGIHSRSFSSSSVGTKTNIRQVEREAIRVDSSTITICLVIEKISSRDKHVSFIVNRSPLRGRIFHKIRVLQGEDTVGFYPNSSASRVALVE